MVALGIFVPWGEEWRTVLREPGSAGFVAVEQGSEFAVGSYAECDPVEVVQ